MFTRQDYMNGTCSHEEYYAQFDCNGMRQTVILGIGLEALLKSRDKHLNDIPLHRWDSIAPIVRGIVADKNVKLGAYKKRACSLADCVCALKQSARMIIEEERGKR